MNVQATTNRRSEAQQAGEAPESQAVPRDEVERSRTIDRLEQVITQDIGGRGLSFDPKDNLVTRCRGNLGRAASDLASEGTSVAIVTGFFVAHAERPSIETDGPCGAIALAWLLTQLHCRVTLITDELGFKTLQAGLRAAVTSASSIGIEVFPWEEDCETQHETAAAPHSAAGRFVDRFYRAGLGDSLTHLISIERAGPSWIADASWDTEE